MRLFSKCTGHFWKFVKAGCFWLFWDLAGFLGNPRVSFHDRDVKTFEIAVFGGFGLKSRYMGRQASVRLLYRHLSILGLKIDA